MEKYNLRNMQIIMVASIALFFTIVAYGNIAEYESTLNYVQHIVSMDTTFKNPAVMWHAITNPFYQALAYWLIIIWQIITAIICWLGCFTLYKGSKRLAFIGLFLGFLLYMVGFITLAGEWFSMWQSRLDAQMKSGLFLSCIMFVMLFLKD